MLRPFDNYFDRLNEPIKGCLLALKDFISGFDDAITQEWKYSMPFFYHKGKMLCYFHTHKKTGEPYIGFVDGGLLDFPELVQEKRARMKILPINPEADIDLALLGSILKASLDLRK